MMAETKDIKYNHLDKIDYPEDLKKYQVDELPAICSELREFMIDTITKTGGHFGAGLGVVELTVALHYVYNTPTDKIIFDVGHQGYPHKILTGRKELLHTIRKKNGLSGFLKPAESPYDAFAAGHASTSISAALGIATARDILKENYRVAAVIGDGSLTGGMAFEAMNNCGVQKRDITVILNDNNMSIDPNVSAFSNYFNELYASSAVQRMRENIWEFTGKMDSFGDRIRKIASKIEDGVKAIITPGVLFESMGFNYIGPINGHNVKKLVKILASIKDVKGPVLLHIMTQKGKGYKPAENDDHYFHAIGKIDKDTGVSVKSSGDSVPNWSTVFGDALTELAKKDDKIIAITAAMIDGTGLEVLHKALPERIIDVGIAEEHAVTSAAGMAISGIKPVVAIYSSFLQRAFDQVAHDVCLQNLPVIFAIDRAGFVGEDGQTHHGLMDLVFLRTIVNMIVTAPKDEQELRDLLFSAIYHYKAPFAIRYPRGKTIPAERRDFSYIPLGTWEQVRKGNSIAILAVGNMIPIAEKACDILSESDISPEIINARFIKPLDTNMLNSIKTRFDYIITLEEGNIAGGFGAAVSEYYASIGFSPNLTIFGIKDEMYEHGTQAELLKEAGLDADSIVEKILNLEKKLKF